MISGAIKDLRYIQRDMNGVIAITIQFIDTISKKLETMEIKDLDIAFETELPLIRSRKRKLLSDEGNNDDPITDPITTFTVEVHNVILDNIITSMEKKFLKNLSLYTDLACLFPTNFRDLNKSNFPPNALTKFANKIKQFDKSISRDGLLNELYSFYSNWHELKKSVPESYKVANYDDLQYEDNVEIKTTQISHCVLYMNCSICCYLMLLKYNLHSYVYSSLTTAYKYLLTLPCTQMLK